MQEKEIGSLPCLVTNWFPLWSGLQLSSASVLLLASRRMAWVIFVSPLSVPVHSLLSFALALSVLFLVNDVVVLINYFSFSQL